MTERKTITMIKKGKEEPVKEKVKEKFSKEDINRMLKGYKEIRIRDLEKTPLRVGIKYEDGERFKFGGMLMGVDKEMVYILNRGRKFNVEKKGLKRVWVQDTAKIEAEREKEEQDIEKGLNLLEKYNEGRIKVFKSGKELEEAMKVYEVYKAGLIIMCNDRKDKEKTKRIIEKYKNGELKTVRK